MSKKLLKGISIGIGVSLLLVVMGSFAFAAKELTPDEWSKLSWQDKIKAKKVVIRDHLWTSDWMEEKNLPTDVTGVREKIHSGDLGTPLNWYNVALFEILHPNVYIKPIHFEPWHKEAITQLTAMIAAGNAPSVYNVRAPSLAVAKGLTADITDLVKNWDQWSHLTENYFGIWKISSWVGGRCYSLMGNRITCSGMTYRKDWFKKAGIFDEEGIPGPSKDWTWNDLREIAKKITNPKQKRWGMGVRMILNISSAYDMGLSYAVSHGYPLPCDKVGESWVIPDKSGKYTWKFGYIPQIAEGIKFIHDMRWEDKSILYGPVDGTSIIGDWNAGRIGIRPYGAVWDAFYDPLLHPHKYDPVVESKDIIGCTLAPKGPYGVKLNDNIICSYWFDSTLNKEQLKAAFDWAAWNLCGKGWINRLRNFADTSSIKANLSFLYNIYTNPYKVELPSDVKKVVDELSKDVPEQWKRVWKRGVQETPYIMSPLDYGLRIDPGGLTILVQMRNGLLLQENLTMDNIKAEMEKTAKKINRKILNYKVKGDKEKLKAYVTALDEFYKKNFPKWYNSKEYKEYMEEYWKVW